MRAELAGAMGALIASADTGVRSLTDVEGRAADQARQCRDLGAFGRRARLQGRGGQRSCSGDADPVRQATGSGRARSAVLWHACRAAMRLAVRCARDSIEPLRRDLLLDVAANPGTDPSDVHRRIVRPLSTVKNNLVALHMLRLVDCEEREERRGNRVVSVPYYRLAPELDRATLLGM